MGIIGRSYLTGILFFLLLSCNNKHQFNVAGIGDNSIIMKGHYAPSLFSSCLGYGILNEKEYLYGYNKLDDVIQFIPIKKENEIIRIYIDSVRKFISQDNLFTKAFCLINNNLFLLSANKDTILQMSINSNNGNFEEIEYYRISKSFPNGSCGLVKFNPNQPIFLFNNNTVALPIECYNELEVNIDTQLYSYALFSVNKNKRLDFIKYFGELPFNYYNNNYYTNETSAVQIPNTNKIVISYCYNDSVDIIDAGEFKKRVILKSKHSNVFNGINDINDIGELRKHFLMGSKYNTIGYCTKYDLYYRTFIADHSLEKSNRKIEQSPTWTMVLYDNNFCFINEFVFHSKIYEPGLAIFNNDNFYLRDYSKNIVLHNGVNINYCLTNFKIVKSEE
jgi:hypothetical protein